MTETAALETITPPLNEREARRLADRIRRNLTTLAEDIYELYSGKGWLAFNPPYVNWRACVEAEFSVSYTHAMTLIRGVESREELAKSTNVSTSPTPTILQAAELKTIKDVEQRAEVWSSAITPEGKPPTQNQLRDKIKAVRDQAAIAAPPTPIAPSPMAGVTSQPGLIRHFDDAKAARDADKAARRILAGYFKADEGIDALQRVSIEQAFRSWQALKPTPITSFSETLRRLSRQIDVYADSLAEREANPVWDVKEGAS
jgi:hypothetical protein